MIRTLTAAILLVIVLGGGFLHGALGTIIDDTTPDWDE